MTKAELQNIINQFDEDSLKKEAVFGIFQFGGGSDESFIKANKEGLTLFAIQLLKSAKEHNTIENGKKSVPFEYEESWIDGDSDTFVQYIEFAEKKDFKKETPVGLKDRLTPIGCVFALIILLALIITGLVTFFKWLF